MEKFHDIAYGTPMAWVFDGKKEILIDENGDVLNKYITKFVYHSKEEGLELIMDQILSNLFIIWERYSKVNRDELLKKYERKPTIEEKLTHDFKRKAPLEAYFDEYKKKVLSEWYFTEEDIEKKHFVDKDITLKKDAFEHLDNLILKLPSLVHKQTSELISKTPAVSLDHITIDEYGIEYTSAFFPVKP